MSKLEVSLEPLDNPGEYRIIFTYPDGERRYVLANEEGLAELIAQHRKQKPFHFWKFNQRMYAGWRAHLAALVKLHNFILHREGICDCEGGPY